MFLKSIHNTLNIKKETFYSDKFSNKIKNKIRKFCKILLNNTFIVIKFFLILEKKNY